MGASGVLAYHYVCQPLLTTSRQFANKSRHRASTVDQNARVSRLQTIVQPVIDEWQNPELTEALSTFPGFCRLVGLDGLPEYLSSRDYAKAQDWTNTPLDEQGKTKQTHIQARISVSRR